MVRDQGWLDCSTAIHKIMGKPAARYALKDRGKLTREYFADIVGFRPEVIGSPATSENPDRPPLGIAFVYRNGCPMSI